MTVLGTEAASAAGYDMIPPLKGEIGIEALFQYLEKGLIKRSEIYFPETEGEAVEVYCRIIKDKLR